MVEDVEDVIVGCVLDVFAGGLAHFEDLFCCKYEVAAEGGVLYEHGVFSGYDCVYNRHILFLSIMSEIMVF